MSIEDRVRRVLAEAVAAEPPLRGAPLDHALRRRGRRPVLVGAVAMALVLAAVVALAAVRGRPQQPPVGPTPTTTPATAPTTTASSPAVATGGWRTYTDAAHNLRFRYPPDWVLRRRNQEATVTLAPREHARRMLAWPPPFAVTVTAGGSYYVGEAPEPGMTAGRLPGGQAYLRWESEIDLNTGLPGLTTTTAPGAARRARVAGYSIDWGRDCKGVKPYRCGPHGVLVNIQAADPALWQRHLAAAEAIVRSARPVTPTRPSHGDRSRPACRPNQWRVIWSEEYGFAGPQRLFLGGGVRYLGGGPCHLRTRLELLVERDGRQLPLPGNPATRTLEGDLPEDAITREDGSLVMRGGPLFWSFIWDEWCNKGLEGPTLRLSAPNGQRLRIGDPAPAATPSPAFRACQDRGRPSRLAGWPS
jgi:hypothetical protein